MKKTKVLIYLLLVISFFILLTLGSYLYLDKVVAHQFHHDYHLFKWFSYISNILIACVMLGYLIVIVRYFLGVMNYFDKVLLAVTNSIVIATFLKEQFKFLFGRFLLKTWINKPSLIINHSHSFHFPSGHTAVIVAAATTLWYMYPKLRWLAALAVLAVVVGLISMDYHFVSDVIAGALLGFLTGFFVVKLSNATFK